VQKEVLDFPGVANLEEIRSRMPSVETPRTNPALMTMLTEVRADDPALTKVKLHGQNLDDVGCTCLCNALQTNSTITSLSLGGNAIGDEGATALANTLRFNHSISTIWLGNNLIGDEGAIELGDALLSNSTLSVLSLHNNKIGDKGARNFLKALGYEVWEQSSPNSTATEHFGGGDENKNENARGGSGGSKSWSETRYTNARLVSVEDGPGPTSCMLEMLNLHGNLVCPTLQALLQEVAEISIYEEEDIYNTQKKSQQQLQIADSTGERADSVGSIRSSTPKRRLQQARQFDSSLRDEEGCVLSEGKEESKEETGCAERMQAGCKEEEEGGVFAMQPFTHCSRSLAGLAVRTT
jgi:hypothetical protein